MAVASAPSVVNTGTLAAWRVSQAKPPYQRIGSIVVNPGDNTSIPLGGLIDVWYCRATHSLFIDIVDTQQGGGDANGPAVTI